MKKYLRKILMMAAVFVLFTAQNVLAATVKPAPKYLNITTGNPQVMKNDKFFVSINLSNANKNQKTEIKMDGQVIKTCGVVFTCKGEIGPFSDEEIGEHIYSFLITGKNGVISEPWGKFEVVDGDKDQYGDWFKKIRIVVSSYQYEIGKKYNILLQITDKKMVYYMDAAIDNEELMDMSFTDKNQNLGARTYSSGRSLPAFKKQDIGEHTFSFTVKAPNGDLIELGGSFWIVDKGQIMPLPVDAL